MVVCLSLLSVTLTISILARELEEQDDYKWYGAKGITYCEEWQSFESFREWAEQAGYSDGLELDRKDTSKNYEPENCRWVTKLQNIRNRDMFWSVELDEKLVEYARKKNMNPYAVIEQALTAFLVEGVVK